MKYKFILWDVDGTLIDFEKSEDKALRICFSNHGKELTDELFDIYKKINRSYWEMLEKGKIEKSLVCTKRFEDFFPIIGITGVTPADFNNEYQKGLGKHCEMYDGAYKLCEKLKSFGAKQYVVSNGSITAQKSKLSATGLDKLFDGIFISDAIGHQKPEPEFFEYVFDNIPDFLKQDAILIGDNPICDIDGGNTAGIDTCYFNPCNKDYSVTPTYICHDFNEIEKLLLI